jgi:hypothetical protein
MPDVGRKCPAPGASASCILCFVFRNIFPFKGRSIMSITRVGATKQYSDGWDNIFGGGKSRTSGKKQAARPAAKSSKKKSVKAKAKGKSAKRPARKK